MVFSVVSKKWEKAISLFQTATTFADLKDDELQENDFDFSYRQHFTTRIWNLKKKPKVIAR